MMRDVGEQILRDGKDYRPAETVTTSAETLGSGIGRLSSRRPSRWNSMASRIKCCASSLVLPVVITPGKSGTYALHPVADFSKMTTYFIALGLLASRNCSKYRAADRRLGRPGNVARPGLTGCLY